MRRVQMTGAAISVTVDGEPTGVGVVLLRQQSVVAPESPRGLAVGEQVLEVVDGLRQLISAFDDVGPQDMTDVFYVHAFNEYDIAVRELLQAVDRGTGSSMSI